MNMDISSTLSTSAYKYPDKLAIISGPERITYRELDRFVNRLAHALLRLGIRKGSHIATLSYNSIELITLYYALLRIGAVVVPLNFRYHPRELAWVIRHSDSQALIYPKGFQETVESLPLRSGEEINLLPFEGGIQGLPFFKDCQRAFSDRPPQVSLREEEPALLAYTSGTTGRPKGVLLNHRQALWMLLICVIARRDRFEAVSFVVHPLFHAASLFGHLLARILMGATVVMESHFDPQALLDLVEREGMTDLPLVPAMWKRVMEVARERSRVLPSIRQCSAGVGGIDFQMRREILEWLPHVRMQINYGLTEAAGAVTMLDHEDLFRDPACIGKVLPTFRVGILGDHGHFLPAGEMGEIVVQGPCVMEGYYRECRRHPRAFYRGWLRTGDMGWMDQEGFLYFVDRRKDRIKSGGENISSKEVENVLSRHPKIGEVAVIGIPDENWGESVRAIIVPQAGEVLTEEEVIEFWKTQMAGYKRPRSFVFTQNMPRDHLGKISKEKLKEKYGSRKKPPLIAEKEEGHARKPDL